MAKALQPVTRKAAVNMRASAALADRAPSANRHTSEAPTVSGMTYGGLANAATSKGIAAPAVKLPAEKTAACRGRARDLAGKSEFIARVSGQRVVRHELLGDLLGESCIESAVHINVGQFAVLAGRIDFELGALLGERRRLAIGLGMHRNILPGGHRHGTRHQPRHPAQKNTGM